MSDDTGSPVKIVVMNLQCLDVGFFSNTVLLPRSRLRKGGVLDSSRDRACHMDKVKWQGQGVTEIVDKGCKLDKRRKAGRS